MKTYPGFVFTSITILFSFLAYFNSFSQGEGEYHQMTLNVDGLDRDYILYEPEGHTGNEEWPLVFVFHGFTSSPTGILNYVKLYALADTAKFFIAYPYGLNVQDLIFGGAATGWHVPGTYSASHDDVRFVDAIIEDLIENPDFAVDTNFIHATGHSNGGEMAFYLACALSGRIASAAGVSSQMALVMMDSICTPGRQVSALHILGTNDPFYPKEGDDVFPPLEGAAEYWAAIDNCNSIPAETELPDIDPNDNTTVTLLDYEACDFGFEVLCYRIEGGWHCWPGAGGNCNNDISASEEIWLFFQRNPHPDIYSCLPGGITFSTQAKIDNFPNDYPYCREISGDVEISGSSIADLNGLGQVETIDGFLDIHDNENLESLSGLSGLQFINGDFLFANNDMIPDFSHLTNLAEINGDLKITDNEMLSSLDGLDSVSSASIIDLDITGNSNLSYCHIQSICYYLWPEPNGSVIIQDNAPGCVDSATVRQSCSPPVNIEELESLRSETMVCYPNPFSDEVVIEFVTNGDGPAELKIFNYLGERIELIRKETTTGKHQLIWKSKGLPAGIYFCVLQTLDGSKTMKMVKM